MGAKILMYSIDFPMMDFLSGSTVNKSKFLENPLVKSLPI